MEEINKPLSWKDHNGFFADLARKIPWVPRFRLWSYYLLLDRKMAGPVRKVFKFLADLLYVVYFLSKCVFFSIFAHRVQFPAGKTLIFLGTSPNHLSNMVPVISELNKRKHDCVIICNQRVQKQVIELYSILPDGNFFLLSFERALSTVGRIKSVKNCVTGLVEAWRDLLVLLGSDQPAKCLLGPHFFVWSFYQHLFSRGCTNLLSVSRNMLSLNDYFLWESLYYFNARNLPIETFVLQHGVFGMAYDPPLTKKYLLWGPMEKAQFTGSLGCSEDACIMIGSPKYDRIRKHYLQRKKPFAERKKIIFLSSMLNFFSKEHRPEYLKICEWFFRLSTLDAAAGYEFILKIHTFEKTGSYKELFRNCNSKVSVQTGELFDLLLDAKITISHSSTAIYESLVMEIPSIQLVPESLPAGNKFWEWGITQKAATFEELEQIVMELLTDNSHYQATVKDMNLSIDNAFCNIGCSSEVISDLLDKSTGNLRVSLSKKSGCQPGKQDN